MWRRSTDLAALLLCSLLCVGATLAWAAPRQYLQVFVAEPYLELRTGPGRGYPVTQVVARGESVQILKRRTDWFRVRTERGIEGWASQRDMVKTLLVDGSHFEIDLGDRDGFTSHRYELGAFAGDFDGANLVSGYGAVSLNDNLKIDLTVSQYLGEQRNGYMIDVGLNHVFVPEWRLSPFVTLGGGLFRVDKDAQRPNLIDRTDQSAYYGFGLRFYLTRRFFIRAEYKERVIFTSRNDNEELEEWKVGLAFFF
ncbi:MAG: SH3 domain-containing protein [Steroidobacteraceae bacterium]